MTCKPLLVLLLLVNWLSATGQKKNEGYFLLFDKDNNTVKEVAKADYFLNVRQLNDTTWRYDYYNVLGPRIRTETFKDEDGSIPHGRFAFYNMFGYLDSVGDALNGKRHGDWHYYSGDDSFKITRIKTYSRGVLVEEWDDSQPGSEKFTSEGVEAKFNGSFKKFLEKTLKYPERAQKMGVANIVTIGFVLDMEGNITDPLVFRSLEYSLDRESERVINLSTGKWTPGYINGKPVFSCHRQSINFVLEEEPAVQNNNGRLP